MTQPTLPTSPDHSREIPLGATVEGADHARFGHVVGTYRNYLIVERGFFLPIDYYVPMRAVRDVDGETVTLGVSRDVALTQGWEHPPFTSGTARPPAPRPGPAAPSRPAAAAARARQPTSATPPTSGAAPAVTGGTGASITASDQAIAAPARAATQTGGTPERAGSDPAPPRFAPRMAQEPVPVSGPFADTYAVGTNTDSYQALDEPAATDQTLPRAARLPDDPPGEGQAMPRRSDTGQNGDSGSRES